MNLYRLLAVCVLSAFSALCVLTNHRYFAGCGLVLVFMALAGRKEEQ